jgi:hypothetical protein
MLRALESLLRQLDADAWEAELRLSDLEQPEPRGWVLRLAGPGHVTIRAVRPEAQNIEGVRHALREAAALVPAGLPS